jgi:hypothetical protein
MDGYRFRHDFPSLNTNDNQGITGIKLVQQKNEIRQSKQQPSPAARLRKIWCFISQISGVYKPLSHRLNPTREAL